MWEFPETWSLNFDFDFDVDGRLMDIEEELDNMVGPDSMLDFDLDEDVGIMDDTDVGLFYERSLPRSD